MEFTYLVTPFVAWLAAGSIKFAINSLRAGEMAFGLIGYGGMPSNHSAIVSSMVVLIALREGLDSAAFGVALTLAYIVMLDANSLRRQVGRHAEMINRLSPDEKQLRERMGHTGLEILGGILVGTCVAWLTWQLGLSLA